MRAASELPFSTWRRTSSRSGPVLNAIVDDAEQVDARGLGIVRKQVGGLDRPLGEVFDQQPPMGRRAEMAGGNDQPCYRLNQRPF